jgi:hypothetical protein
MKVEAREPNRADLIRVIVALFICCAAFGLIEAAVVIDLRAVYEPLHARAYPSATRRELFPLLSVEQLKAGGSEVMRLLRVELAREVATLVLLAGIALAACHSARTWLASFVLAFGMWDIWFYVWLKLLVDWPSSLWTWDLLFLLPVPWTAPVAAPLLVALAMTFCGAGMWTRETGRRPVRHAAKHWLAIVAGGALIVASFSSDWRSIVAGNEPRAFRWDLFVLGLSGSLYGFFCGCRGSAGKPDR